MRRGKACVEGSAADGILEDRRGGCSTTQIVGLRAIYDRRAGEYKGYCCREILHVDGVAVFPRRFIPLKRSGFFPLKAGNDGLRAASHLYLLNAHVDCRVRTTPSLSSRLICPLTFAVLQLQLAQNSTPYVAGMVTGNSIVQARWVTFKTSLLSQS